MEELEIIKASDISCREIEWLWYPFIPYGKVTILQGDSGDGKSLMVLTLAAMLTNQLCSDLSESKESFAIDLEDTVIVIAPLIPWSIASSVPLTTLGVPVKSLLAACLLYLLPLSRFAKALIQKKKSEKY